ncbi:hypothetical protein P7H17_00045 [Paenibacillus larvae]|nr:hypothetical protein [Paenibacillus larvae]MDT2284835.1 hypothetical protein [Paenibacillus larvae]
MNAEANVKRKKGTSEIPLFEDKRNMSIEEKNRRAKSIIRVGVQELCTPIFYAQKVG